MDRIYLNDSWGFTEEFKDEMKNEDFPEESLENVRLPHTNKVTPYNNFDESIYEMVCGYRKEFLCPESWKGKHVLLTFEGAAHKAYVYINGIEAGNHSSGYTAFTLDISEYLNYGGRNVIAVKLDTRESLNQPPFGNVIDYMTYGGLYREVYIEIKNEIYINDVFVYTDNCDKENKGVHVEVSFNMPADGMVMKASVINEINHGIEETPLGEYEIKGDSAAISETIKGVTAWTLENPKLYYLKIEIIKEGMIADSVTTRFGFREAWFDGKGFYLNGKMIKLRGLNRHQSYPYVGYAMPKSQQERDADILKYELGCNVVRTSHYPQSQHFINRCDEIGLLVVTEIPGWQYIGDDEWKNTACDNVREMIMQYRNHPSIILWGVRINESDDDDDFYTKTNDIAETLDPSRQSGGVRCTRKSSFLEDVYTFNDFIYDGTGKPIRRKTSVVDDEEIPYLITEYNGHMFPTKSFDCEGHRLEHALRHAAVINEIAGTEGVAGGIGWCMFDYNTHKDFGSGDRICYHGVLDMFRNPKMASYVYSSQGDDRDFFELSSSMDIWDHPASRMGDIYAFTNADSIKVYKNGEFIKEYDAHKSPFSNMAHGPVLIDDLIGDTMEKGEGFSHEKSEDIKKILREFTRAGFNHLSLKTKLICLKLMITEKMKFSDFKVLFDKYVGDWGGSATSYRFEAIKDGKCVKTLEKKALKSVHIYAESDRCELIEEHSYDVASVRIRALDDNNNTLVYYNEPLSLQCSGPIEIIGPHMISLKGGMGGTYVKTLGKPGDASLLISGNSIEPVKVTFNIEI